MASVDAVRRRVRLSEAELDVLAVVVADPSDPVLSTSDGEAALASLSEAEVVRGREVLPWIAELAIVAAAPALRLTVETFTVGPVLTYPVWATPSLAVLGAPLPDGSMELSSVEPAHVPWALARAVGLGRRPPAPIDRVVELPTEVLGSVMERVGEGDLAGASSLLRSALPAEDEADAVLALCRDRRLSWRVTSQWVGEAEGLRTRSLTVLDAGSSGLWLSEPSTDRSSVRLVPTRPSAVWRRLLELLPPPRREPVAAGAAGG